MALRVGVWILAILSSWQPFDFADDFSAAAAAVLHHHDPLLTARLGGWHFLPPMAFVFAGELWFCYAANLPWQLVGRLAPVVADLALIPLVGRLAPGNRRLRQFQYACNPLSIMICALHGQIEPEMLALGVAAFVVARSARGRAGTGRGPGILLGLSVAMGTWSVLLLPGLLRSLPGRLRQLRAAGWTVFVPAAVLLTSPLTVGTPVGKLPQVLRTLVGAQPVVGDWGWTVIPMHGQEGYSAALARPGMLVLVVALFAALYLWRRADPIDLTMALLITFLIFTPRLGDQYLMWPLPFLIARQTRFSTQALLTASVWVAFGELYLGPMSPAAWQHVHVSWAYLSLLVAGSLVLALVGISRRQPQAGLPPVAALPAGAAPAPGPREPDAAGTLATGPDPRRMPAPALAGPSGEREADGGSPEPGRGGPAETA